MSYMTLHFVRGHLPKKKPEQWGGIQDIAIISLKNMLVIKEILLVLNSEPTSSIKNQRVFPKLHCK